MFKFVFFIHYHYVCVLYYYYILILTYHYCYLCNHYVLDIMTSYEVFEIYRSREFKFDYKYARLNHRYGTWHIGIIYKLNCYDYRE